ncbi:hypothetical protein K502DRAFT_363843 [Neoconidiobolus thromboides FSU 785]|nr:hypothetical protein K502DRAFT_363843 [Neoconidiobolus thromboides FSU 785]
MQEYNFNKLTNKAYFKQRGYNEPEPFIRPEPVTKIQEERYKSTARSQLVHNLNLLSPENNDLGNLLLTLPEKFSYAIKNSTFVDGPTNFPIALKEKIEESKEDIKAGFLGYLNFAYFIIDGNLYLWNYQQDVIKVELQKSDCLSVHLAKAKKECFDDNVEWTLMICCKSTLSVVGIYFDIEKNLQFAYSPYTLEYAFSKDVTMVSTIDGRVFFTNNDEIYEVFYQLRETLFSRRLEVKKLTSPNLMSSLFGSTSGYSKIVLDEDRKLLYAFKSIEEIVMISLGEKGNQFIVQKSFKFDTTNIDPLYSPKIMEALASGIIELHPIPLAQSNIVRFVILTHNGASIFYRENKNSINNRALPLEYHAFLSPAATINIDLSPVTFYNNGLTLSSYKKEEKTLISSRYLESTPGLNDNKINDLVYNYYVKGDVLDMIELPPVPTDLISTKNNGISLVTPDDTVGQYYRPFRTFMILTTEGLYCIQKFRPIDCLEEAITKSPNDRVENFKFNSILEYYGKAEVICMLLFLLSHHPVSRMGKSGYTGMYGIVNRPTRQIKLMKQCYKYIEKIKDKATLQSIEVNSLKKYWAPGSTIWIKNSASYIGFLKLVTRLLQPIWKTHFIKSLIIDNNNTFEFGASKDILDVINPNLTAVINLIHNISHYNEYKRLGTEENDTLTGPTSVVNNNLESEWEEIELFRQLRQQVDRARELINFQQILLELNDAGIFNSLEQDTINKISSLTFEDLTDINKWHILFNQIIAVVVKEKGTSSTENVSVLSPFKHFCPNILSEDSYHYFKGLENILIASVQPSFHLSTLFIRLAQDSFDEMKTILSTDKLLGIIQDYCELGFCNGALMAIANTITKINNQKLELNFEAKKIEIQDYYQLAIIPLTHIYPIMKANFNAFEFTKDYRNIKASLMKIFNSCLDKNFHYVIYEWFMESGHIKMLIEFQTPYLEQFLKEKHSSIDNEFLQRYLSHHKRYLEATEIYFKRAIIESSEMSLQKRIEFLQKADYQSDDFRIKDKSYNRDNIRKNIKYMLRIARLQDLMVKELISASHLAKDLTEEAIKGLNFKLYEPAELYDEFIESLELPISEIAITILFFNQSKSRKELIVLIEEWYKLLKKNTVKVDFPKTLRENLNSIVKAVTKCHETSYIKYWHVPLFRVFAENINTITLEWVIDSLSELGYTSFEILGFLMTALNNDEYPFSSPKFCHEVLNLIFALIEDQSDTMLKNKHQDITHALSTIPHTVPTLTDRIKAYEVPKQRFDFDYKFRKHRYDVLNSYTDERSTKSRKIGNN